MIALDVFQLSPGVPVTNVVNNADRDLYVFPAANDVTDITITLVTRLGDANLFASTQIGLVDESAMWSSTSTNPEDVVQVTFLVGRHFLPAPCLV